MIAFTESVENPEIGLRKKHLNILNEHRMDMEPGGVTDNKVDREERIRVA